MHDRIGGNTCRTCVDPGAVLWDLPDGVPLLLCRRVSLDVTDRTFLRHAIEVSRRALTDEGKTPFGAVLVIEGQIVAERTSSVIELRDPTAPAEVMALRHAGEKLHTHLFPDAVMYTSSEPCPMCLAACYWATVPRLVYGATSYDVATHGVEDLQFHRELTLRAEVRALREDPADDDLHAEATDVLRCWAEGLPIEVVPKY